MIDGMIPNFKRTRFCLLTCVFLGTIFLAAYFGTYWHLSRRELAEASRGFGQRCFLYVRLEDLHDSDDFAVHTRRRLFFAPANWIDRHLFGGPSPILGITFKLGWERSRKPFRSSACPNRPPVPSCGVTQPSNLILTGLRPASRTADGIRP